LHTVRYSVIIPAYNEAHRIADTVCRVVASFENPASAEVVVVDDGSTDGTAAAASGEGVRVLRNRTNRGKGHSVTRGMMEARGELLLFTDADLAVGTEQFQRVLRPLQLGEDVVIASRRHADSRILVPQPKAREAMGVVFNLLVRVLLLRGLTDTQCGLKGFRRRVAHEIFSRVTVTGWCFDVEVLSIARARGYKITEVPVDWCDSGETRLRALQTAWEILRDLTAVFWRRRLGVYYKRS
jgi:dolichyl-phosphate beta-glucosyltransferase